MVNFDLSGDTAHTTPQVAPHAGVVVEAVVP
jgi:hypothetical protein